MNPELLEIALLNPPPPVQHSVGFLDIVGHTNKEDTISRVYAHFLNQNTNPALAKVFINALLELIKEQTTNSIELNEFSCRTEVATNKGFIDLLIESTDGQTSIIIENKIYHILNNDLEDYYNHPKAPNKVGVLLTLILIPVPIDVKGKYYNITHRQWMEKIEQLGLPAGLSIKEYVYVNDFITNLKKLSTDYNMNEQTQFFFANAEKIMLARRTYDEAFGFIVNQIEVAGGQIGLKLNGGSSYWYRYLWDYKSEVYYTIDFEGLMTKNNKTLIIIIELYKGALEKNDNLKQLLQNDAYYQNLVKEPWRDKYHIHFATQAYRLALSDIETLGTFITKKINTEFAPVMKKIENYLNAK